MRNELSKITKKKFLNVFFTVDADHFLSIDDLTTNITFGPEEQPRSNINVRIENVILIRNVPMIWY